MSIARRGPRIFSLGAALAVACLACGGSTPAHPGDGGAGADGAAVADGGTGPSTALAFCNAYRDLAGAYAARCNGGRKEDWIASSEAFVTCAEFDARVAAGRVVYHRELAQACLDAYDPQRACAVADDLCFAKVLPGKVAYGQACKGDFDCPPEGLCFPDAEFSYNACVPAVCKPLGTRLGDSCAEFGFCVGMSCLDTLCVASGTVGAPCGPGLAGCAGGLTCDLAAGKCVPRGGDGAACLEDTDCLTTHACFVGTCRARLELGAPCLGADTACTGFTACNPVSGKCEDAGHVGQQCAGVDGRFNLCINGVCRRDAHGVPTCFAKGKVGDACKAGDECVTEGCDNGRCADCSALSP